MRINHFKSQSNHLLLLFETILIVSQFFAQNLALDFVELSRNSGNVVIKISLFCPKSSPPDVEYCSNLIAELRVSYLNTVEVVIDDSKASDKFKALITSHFADENLDFSDEIVLHTDLKANLREIVRIVDSRMAEYVDRILARNANSIYILEDIASYQSFLRILFQKPMAIIKTNGSNKKIEEIRNTLVKKSPMKFVFAVIRSKNEVRTRETEALLNLLEFQNTHESELLLMDNGAYLGHHELRENDLDASIARVNDQLIPNHSGSLVLYYVNWCQHCQRAKPEWFSAKSEAEKLYPSVKFLEYDCDVDKDQCSQADIRGYPTIKVLDSEYNSSEYNGNRSKSDFLKTAKSLANKAVASYKSVKDSALKLSESPLNARELLSISDLYYDHTNNQQQQQKLLILVLVASKSPEVNSTVLERFSSALQNSACGKDQNFQFFFYLPENQALNTYLHINTDRQAFKLIKLLTSASSSDLFVVDNLQIDRLNDLEELVKYCNFSQDAAMHSVRRTWPIFSPLQPYLPFYTAIGSHHNKVVNELGKELKMPVKLIYEGNNILYEVNDIVLQSNRKQVDLTRTKEIVDDLSQQYRVISADV